MKNETVPSIFETEEFSKFNETEGDYSYDEDNPYEEDYSTETLIVNLVTFGMMSVCAIISNTLVIVCHFLVRNKEAHHSDIFI